MVKYLPSRGHFLGELVWSWGVGSRPLPISPRLPHRLKPGAPRSPSPSSSPITPPSLETSCLGNGHSRHCAPSISTLCVPRFIPELFPGRPGTPTVPLTLYRLPAPFCLHPRTPAHTEVPFLPLVASHRARDVLDSATLLQKPPAAPSAAPRRPQLARESQTRVS